ncbi:hypothetical protein [Pseudonocardia thermophila]|uniref:hypothetical protein n=1 Tax=Pseudonocardia thermophila TaxID=1848 RepID=UPI000935BA48|nr:hypothetical protein [Pseudonocardia thermophila]
MVVGAATFRQLVGMVTDVPDAWFTAMRSMPAYVVSSTLAGAARLAGRHRWCAATPSTSSRG